MLYRYDVNYRFTAPGWNNSLCATDTFIAENEEDAMNQCCEWNESEGYEVIRINDVKRRQD